MTFLKIIPCFVCDAKWTLPKNQPSYTEILKNALKEKLKSQEDGIFENLTTSTI